MIKLVRSYLVALQEFGRVRFEIQPFMTAGGEQRREVAVLPESQATLLLSLMKNSPKVVDFKVRLVKEFYWMREELQNQTRTPAQLTRMEILKLVTH